MSGREQLEPSHLGMFLLLLQKELKGIDSSRNAEVDRFAGKAIDALPMELTEKERNDLIRKLQLDDYDTFEILSIDMSAFLKEVRGIRTDDLEDAIISSLDGEDKTPHIFAQNIELLKELSIVSGYLTKMTDAASIKITRTPLGEFYLFFANYTRNKAANEQRKSYLVCHRLLERSEKEGRKITDIQVTLMPWLGYDKQVGMTENYQEFRRRLNETSQAYFNAGMHLASERIKLIRNVDRPFVGII